jgi:hypothetical protein
MSDFFQIVSDHFLFLNQLSTISARFHENDKPGPSFTAAPESPPNLPHLVHTYIYVCVDRFTDQPATPHPARAKSQGQ